MAKIPGHHGPIPPALSPEGWVRELHRIGGKPLAPTVRRSLWSFISEFPWRARRGFPPASAIDAHRNSSSNH